LNKAIEQYNSENEKVGKLKKDYEQLLKKSRGE
jgi:hypothetical protein